MQKLDDGIDYQQTAWSDKNKLSGHYKVENVSNTWNSTSECLQLQLKPRKLKRFPDQAS